MTLTLDLLLNAIALTLLSAVALWALWVVGWGE
jgi:hypothetical protein